MEENNKNEIYNHYIALDWSKEVVAISTLLCSGSKLETKLLKPEPKIIKEFLKGYPGKKIMTFEETTSQWLYVELKDSVDRILICDPYRNGFLKDGPKNDKRDARDLCRLIRHSRSTSTEFHIEP
ncbi:MAG: hypothetical protein ABI840_12955 [bacterium]